MNENFETRIGSREISVSGIGPEVGLESWECNTTSVADVKWSFEVEARNWGVKSIILSVESVSAQIEVEAELENEEMLRKTIELTPEYMAKEGWTIKNSLKVQKGGCTCPQSVSVDFKTKTVEVE